MFPKREDVHELGAFTWRAALPSRSPAGLRNGPIVLGGAGRNVDDGPVAGCLVEADSFAASSPPSRAGGAGRRPADTAIGHRPFTARLPLPLWTGRSSTG